MNKRRLMGLAKRLDKTLPRAYDQNNWCGTASCLAGHAVLAYGEKYYRDLFKEAVNLQTLEGYDPESSLCEVDLDVESVAQHLLGLDENETYHLFKAEAEWPDRYKTPKGRVTPKRAAKRIRDWLSGKVALNYRDPQPKGL